ncbi:endolytic transglycosylase MltG [Caldibacillus debilis]|jgi:uncharacterized LabA/DUF88 family protein|uniref:Putative periplasmic solute-binding protein n=1 Tax=Caldibacillus debilis GB1 TaxID=1339248 RepID=A0A420VE54_9BACI|nr:endolytic transglycosylase MltG [Caldibacillus debilis]RKO61962.1 putative periplasmic solute-binding protein [Caldibacillus debilis GB1]
MNKRTLRSFSLGMMLAVSAVFCYYHFFYQEKAASGGEERKESGGIVLERKEYEELLAKIEGLEKENRQLQQELAGRMEKTGEPQESGGGKITLEIKKGMTLEDLSNFLKEHQMISDRKKFEQFMVKENYDRKIQTGTFHLTKDMNYTEIAELITASP